MICWLPEHKLVIFHVRLQVARVQEGPFGGGVHRLGRTPWYLAFHVDRKARQLWSVLPDLAEELREARCRWKYRMAKVRNAIFVRRPVHWRYRPESVRITALADVNEIDDDGLHCWTEPARLQNLGPDILQRIFGVSKQCMSYLQLLTLLTQRSIPIACPCMIILHSSRTFSKPLQRAQCPNARIRESHNGSDPATCMRVKEPRLIRRLRS